MPHEILSWALLICAAFAAGAVNAVAGGGTLLTFPALLTLLSPVLANATSTVALVPGSFAALWGYRKELKDSREHLMRLAPPSVLGGIVGSILLIRLPEKVFAHLVPYLLIAASVLLLLQRPISRRLGVQRMQHPSIQIIIAVIVFQFLVAVYGGYFGAGIGILMLSTLAFVGIPDIHRMNAVKNVLTVGINGVTALIFIAAGVVVWKFALIMALASIAGGALGANIAQRMQPQRVRAIVVAIGFGVAVYSWLSSNR